MTENGKDYDQEYLDFDNWHVKHETPNPKYHAFLDIFENLIVQYCHITNDEPEYEYLI